MLAEEYLEKKTVKNGHVARQCGCRFILIVSNNTFSEWGNKERHPFVFHSWVQLIYSNIVDGWFIFLYLPPAHCSSINVRFWLYFVFNVINFRSWMMLYDWHCLYAVVSKSHVIAAETCCVNWKMLVCAFLAPETPFQVSSRFFWYKKVLDDFIYFLYLLFYLFRCPTNSIDVLVL